ncbi:TBC domain-containing protein [Colletotrichum navitas]|uniref:TBC domain-containing protein n=1 Tax=Colletotrichum navitas TaxID=681940 RepID=A0AAD8PQJ0_9PEZI|nr:TBC domain-containing protein [Colletotrichum navitas]KAK1574540.1 TBC domain-containing protein [Colletotrichum navitas]
MTLMAVAADSVQPDAQISSGAMADQDPGINRRGSMKRRQFGIYASRRPHPKPIPTSDVPERPESDFPAAHSQPLPTSPLRWDSLANNSSNFVMQQNSADAHVQPLSPRRTPYDSDRHYPSSPTFRSLAPSPSHDPEDDLSADEWTSRAVARSIKSPFPHDDDSPSLIDTMQVDNFSRPRGPSIKQPLQDSYRSRANQSPSEPRSDPNSHQYAWPRPRGHSGSSARSASTFASLPAAGGEYYEPRAPSRLRSAPPPSGLARPPLAYDRVDSASSGLSAYTREAPWMSGEDEMRSSYRSQTTASSAQGTYVTERSSVLTKNSSIPSLYANGEELSVDDVMGMYEKGFRDDSSPEDNDDVRPVPAAEITKRNTRMLEALSEPRPVHADSLAVPTSDTIVRDSTDMFKISGYPASVPTEVSLPDDDQKQDEKDMKGEKDENEKRDSAKSLQNDAPTVSPHMDSPSASSTQTAVEPEPVEIEEPGTRDRYGFKKANQYITRQQYDAWDKGYSEYLERRRKKWTAFMRENELITDRPERFPPHSAKAKRFVRKGIPPEWRGAAWFYYAGGPAILAKHAGLYDTLLQKKAKDVDVEAIERDLHRTFPDNVKFKPANMASKPNTEPTREGESTQDEKDEPEIISSLRRVLHAFSIYNPRIGYCQSLNFLAGLLLLFMDSEEKAFWLLNVITRVYLPGTHEMSLEGSKVDLGVLMNAIRESMPAVWAKIGDDMEADPNAARPAKPIKKPRSKRKNQPSISSNRLPPITLCMTAWFMSCFIGTLPIESTLRVWDVIFYEGSKTLFRIALAIFKLGEAEVRSISDPMEMFSVIQAMPRRLLDANALMEACFKRRNGFGHISQVTIDTEREERRVKVQTEHQRAATYTSGAAANGNATEGEGEVRRKGTLFGRRKSGRPAEVM